MYTKPTMLSALLVVLMLPGLVQLAWADDDHVEARRLLDAGEILPLESILTSLREEYPGKVLEIKLEAEHQEIVYEVEVLGEDNVVREIYINARTGKIMSSKVDD